jgi:hypothetical protein
MGWCTSTAIEPAHSLPLVPHWLHALLLLRLALHRRVCFTWPPLAFLLRRARLRHFRCMWLCIGTGSWFGSTTLLGLRLSFHRPLGTIGDYISAALHCTVLCCAVIGSTCGLMLLFDVHRRLALHQQLCWHTFAVTGPALAPRLACVAHGSSSALHRASRSPALSLRFALHRCWLVFGALPLFVWRSALHRRSLALCSAWFLHRDCTALGPTWAQLHIGNCTGMPLL